MLLRERYDTEQIWEISLVLYNAGSMWNVDNKQMYYLQKILKKEKELDELFNKTFDTRSEEHTSEIQSHHDLICRLLLEQKKII